MTIQIIEGFEDLDLVWSKARATRPSTTYCDAVTPGYNDEAQGMWMSTNEVFDYVMPALSSGSWRKVSLAIRFEELPSDTGYIVGHKDTTSTLSTSNSDAALQLRSNGALFLRVGPSVYSSDSPASTITANTWYYIEYLHQFGGAGSVAEVYVNGNLVLSGSGDNDGEPWTFCELRGMGANSSYGNVEWDDLIIEDSATKPAVLGPQKVKTLTPTSDAAVAWTGSDGNSTDNYILVSDGSDATYVESTAGANEVDRYGHSVTLSGTVTGVSVSVKANMDAPGTDDFSIACESNGSTDSVPATLGDGSPQWHTVMFETDPDGNVAWTAAKLNAATFGVSS